MKKLIIPFALFILMNQAASAQDQILVATAKKQKEVPVEMVTATTENIGKDIVVTDYYSIPVKLVEEDWNIELNPKNKDLSAKKFENYNVEFFGPNVHGDAFYDRDGNLISFKQKAKDAPLPEIIQKNIFEEFPGWKVSGDRETLTINENKNKSTLYKVYLKKEGEVQKVIYDGKGDLVKAGKDHRSLFN